MRNGVVAQLAPLTTKLSLKPLFHKYCAALTVFKRSISCKKNAMWNKE